MCLAGVARDWQGHHFALCMWELLHHRLCISWSCSPAWDLPYWGCHMSASLQLLMGFPSLSIRFVAFPAKLTVLFGGSRLLSASCTGSKGPCREEIGVSPAKRGSERQPTEMQLAQGHPAGMSLFFVPCGYLLAMFLSKYSSWYWPTRKSLM